MSIRLGHVTEYRQRLSTRESETDASWHAGLICWKLYQPVT